MEFVFALGWYRHRANPKSCVYEVIVSMVQRKGVNYAGSKSLYITMSVVDWLLWSLPGTSKRKANKIQYPIR